LTPLYEGPYEVISKSEKVFKLRMGARVDSVIGTILCTRQVYITPLYCMLLSRHVLSVHLCVH